jgi:hypothetical protein
MPRFLLLAYIVFFTVGAVALKVAYALLVPAREKKNDPWWETSIDLLLLVLALAGMVFLFIDLQAPIVKSFWKPLSIAILVGQLYLNLRGRVAFLRFPRDADIRLAHVRAADLSTLALVAPSSALNLVYAFR